MAEGSDSKSAVAFDAVFQREAEYLERRWHNEYGQDRGGRRLGDPQRPSTANQLVGLAFSGGGIRSATINLGIAQSLFRRGVFRHADYMSTVSGGGYLGSSISTIMRDGDPFPYAIPDEIDTGEAESRTPLSRWLRQVAAGGGVSETPFLTWLRNNSNYLASGGFIDYLRGLAVLVRGILVNFLVLLPWLLLVGVYLTWWPQLKRWESEGFDLSGVFRATPALLGLFFLVVLFFPVFIRVFKAYRHEADDEESSVRSRGLLEKVYAWLLLLTAIAAILEAMPILIYQFHRFQGEGWREIVAGGATGGALVALSSAGKLLSKLGGLGNKLKIAMVGLLGLIIPLLVVLYVTEGLVYDWSPVEPAAGWPWQTGNLPWALLAVLLGLLVGGSVAAIVGRLWRSERAQPARAAIGVALGLAGFALTWAAIWSFGRLGGEAIDPRLFVLVVAAAVFVFCWAAVDVNLTSVHGFYRDRLATAYLVGLGRRVGKSGRRVSRGEGDGGGSPADWEVFVEPDLNLHKICGRTSRAPYHLVNTALNLQGSKDPMLRDRRSDFFVFSKYFCGGPRTGYCSSRDLESVYPQMDLPTAMAISAAAASPNCGRLTNRPLVMLMTLFNIRLGYWVPHPSALCRWLADPARKGKTTGSLLDRWRWRIRQSALVKEMLSRVSEKGKWVNLSDGGHIENLAVYELLRRRCRYIICGDGEADKELSFGGLATLMRFARIDLGIEIDLLLDDLRLTDEGTGSQHCALARIWYPTADRSGFEKDPGYLLYIKSSFTGDEDETMQEYRAKNPDFPHQTTADQFFDEGQFEAYRSLGFHMAEGLFPIEKENGVAATYEDWGRFRNWFESLGTTLAPRLSAQYLDLQNQLRIVQQLLREPEHEGYYYELYGATLEEHGFEVPASEGVREARSPDTMYLVAQQLSLMEKAFISLGLDQRRNWDHEGVSGWRKLFRQWARAPSFRSGYRIYAAMYSGRFRNFCENVLGLPAAEK